MGRLKFKILARIATWAMWKLWWDFKDDPAYGHVTRHIVASLEGGNEVGCREGHCRLEREVVG